MYINRLILSLDLIINSKKMDESDEQVFNVQ